MRKTRIVLAESQSVVRNGIKMLLDAQDDMQVVGDVHSAEHVADLLLTGLEADILLMDVGEDWMGDLRSINVLAEQNIDIAVVVLTGLDNEGCIVDSFRNGVRAYLLKNVPPEEMLFCLRYVRSDRRYLCAELGMRLLDRQIASSNSCVRKIDPAALDLSSREMEVLKLLGEGLTNAEISDRLFLSRRTVEGHRHSLIDKTKSKNTPALIKFAIQHGLLK